MNDTMPERDAKKCLHCKDNGHSATQACPNHKNPSACAQAQCKDYMKSICDCRRPTNPFWDWDPSKGCHLCYTSGLPKGTCGCEYQDPTKGSKVLRKEASRQSPTRLSTAQNSESRRSQLEGEVRHSGTAPIGGWSYWSR